MKVVTSLLSPFSSNQLTLGRLFSRHSSSASNTATPPAPSLRRPATRLRLNCSHTNLSPLNAAGGPPPQSPAVPRRANSTIRPNSGDRPTASVPPNSVGYRPTTAAPRVRLLHHQLKPPLIVTMKATLRPTQASQASSLSTLRSLPLLAAPASRAARRSTPLASNSYQTFPSSRIQQQQQSSSIPGPKTSSRTPSLPFSPSRPPPSLNRLRRPLSEEAPRRAWGRMRIGA